MREDLLRELAPQVLGVLVRRYGQFDACEDAVQEALLAAATQWPKDGVPDSPKAWLVTVASRRMIDEIRSEEARRRREAENAFEEPPEVSDQDDTLTLLFARTVHRLLPDDGEVAGLLALMLLTDARRTARTSVDGALITLDEQDRSVWDKDLIAEGVELVTAALSRGPLGPYQLQAAIAAVHTEEGETDWPQIVALTAGLPERRYLEEKGRSRS